MVFPDLKRTYGEAIIERGENYIKNIKSCIKVKNYLHAQVQGSYLYKTKVNLDTLQGECSCPYKNNCKHAVAAYLYYKKHKISDAAEYLHDLKSLSKEELIKIIEKIIPEKPELIQKATFRKKTDFEGCVNDFIDNFSVNELENIEENLDCFNFEQLMRILDYVDKNEDTINESLTNDYDSYESYDDEDPIFDFKYKLKEEIVKRIRTKEQLDIVLKKRYLNDEIIDNAEIFFRYKDFVKTYFTKEEFLRFLLKLKNPDVSEIKNTLEKGKEYHLYLAAKQNIALGEKLAKYLDSDPLRFIVAYYKEDAKNIIQYFDCFSNFKNHYMVQPELIVKIIAKGKIMPVEIAKCLFVKEYFTHYSEKNIQFLLKRLTDTDFILKNTVVDAKFSLLQEVVKRLEELKYDIKPFFKRKEFMANRHWTEIVDIVKYIKQSLGVHFLNEFIRFHEATFLTSSTLKHNLKKEGILIQNIRGELKVEIQ